MRFRRDMLSNGPVSVKAGGRCIGVFAVDDRVYAIDNICPHADAMLTHGRVAGEVVECAFHNALFHLPTGRCLRGPGRDIATYDVIIDGDEIALDPRPRQTTGHT